MDVHDIRAVMQRAPDFETPERDATFWMLEPFNGGTSWVGRWNGRSPWERHAEGDELLHLLAGEVRVTVVGDDGPTTATMTPGSMFVVPRGRWHRVESDDWVTMCGATSGPTDHAEGEDPPAA